MRLKGRQARFLATVLTLWTMVRFAQMWPDAGVPVDPAGTPVAGGNAFDPRIAGWRDLPGFVPARGIPRIATGRDARRSLATAAAPTALRPPAPGELLMLALGGGRQLAAHAMLRRLVYAADERAVAPADAAPSPPPPTAVPSRWEGQAYLFVRPGSGRAALGPAGQLGGSQAAARIAYMLTPGRPVGVALAARVYAPLRSRGAEAAMGIDLRPVRTLPLRLSIERRMRIDRAGRSAWSAYTAGGLYREKDRIVLDGYGQVGVVGAHRRDLFVDGALRAGVRIGGAGGPVAGAAVWGAAQPGVARLDAGPRLAWRLPVADHGLTVALEGRLRLAGRARPGSGVALTIAADF